MARKNALREARLASQAYAASLRRLTIARALRSPAVLEYYRRPNTWLAPAISAP